MDEDKVRDRRYRRVYGIDLAWYNNRLSKQGRCCAICRRPQELFSKRFAVDHCHKTVRLKISCTKTSTKDWVAVVRLPNLVQISDTAKKKSDAIKKVKLRLKTLSARGLLCPFCNRGLRYYADDPIRLENAAKYLKEYHANVA